VPFHDALGHDFSRNYVLGKHSDHLVVDLEPEPSLPCPRRGSLANGLVGRRQHGERSRAP
jgi:hypothetical protein